jgi:tRNA1Val (adenine37-N6)-methyltransferase
MKVTTDAALFGAWIADEVKNMNPKAKGSEVQAVLDIGTGTGLLALMYVQKNPSANIDAIEMDEDAAIQALENVEAFPRKNLIRVINADVRSFSFRRKYDLIISNPPFYENELSSAIPKKNTARHSRELRLEQLPEIIKNNLKPEGVFFLLLPFKRNREVKELLRANEFAITQTTLVRQSVKHDYFRIMLAGKLRSEKKEETRFNEISIWNERQQYTAEFAELLKDYYLNL